MTVEQVNDILKEHNFELVLDNMFIPLEGSNILYTLDDSGLTVPCSIILTEYDENKGLKRISFELNSDLASLLFARFYIEYYDMRPYLPVEHVAFNYGKSSLHMYFELR